MFSDQQARELFTRVMDRMVEAGWLHHYTFTDGKGWHLAWTLVGTEKATVLRSMIQAFRLGDDDRGGIAFDKLAHGEAPLVTTAFRKDLAPEIAAYWRERVAELGLHGNADGLLGMVHIILGWGPDADTRLQVGVD